MKHTIIILSALSVIATGCSSDQLCCGPDPVEISNNSPAPVLVNLMDQEAANVFDPNPVVPVNEVALTHMGPDESSTFPLATIEGDHLESGLHLFLYEVRNDSAYLERTFDLPVSSEVIISKKGGSYEIDY